MREGCHLVGAWGGGEGEGTVVRHGVGQSTRPHSSTHYSPGGPPPGSGRNRDVREGGQGWVLMWLGRVEPSQVVLSTPDPAP